MNDENQNASPFTGRLAGLIGTALSLLLIAEETYRLARQIYPGCPEANAGLAELLASNHRSDLPQQLAERIGNEQ